MGLSLFPRPATFLGTRNVTGPGNRGSKITCSGQKIRKVRSREFITSVGEYTCNSKTNEGKESTLLVAFLYSPFVP